MAYRFNGKLKKVMSKTHKHLVRIDGIISVVPCLEDCEIEYIDLEKKTYQIPYSHIVSIVRGCNLDKKMYFID